MTVQGVTAMTLDELAGLPDCTWTLLLRCRMPRFIEQHTGISIQMAIEKGFPAYAERVGA